MVDVCSARVWLQSPHLGCVTERWGTRCQVDFCDACNRLIGIIRNSLCTTKQVVKSDRKMNDRQLKSANLLFLVHPVGNKTAENSHSRVFWQLQQRLATKAAIQLGSHGNHSLKRCTIDFLSFAFISLKNPFGELSHVCFRN